MASEASWKAVVLWADELRVASASLRLLYKALNSEKRDNKELDQLLKQAMETCYTALRGVNDDAALVVCEGTAAKFVPRITNVNRKKEEAQK